MENMNQQEEDFKSVGQAVKMLRQMQGLGFEETYTKAEVSKSAYHSLEHGKRISNINTLSKICEALGVSVGSLFILAEKIEKHGVKPLVKQIVSL